jgi:hypothetical protein
MLKELLRDAINIDVPEEWRGRLNALELDGNLGAILEEGTTIGEAITVRIIMAALQGDDGAINQILGSEPKAIDVDLPEGTSVEVPVDKDRIKNVVEILREIGVVS